MELQRRLILVRTREWEGEMAGRRTRGRLIVSPTIEQAKGQSPAHLGTREAITGTARVLAEPVENPERT